MKTIEAGLTYSDEINKKVRSAKDKKVKIENCIGQRYIGGGLSDKEILIEGTPGNALARTA